MWGFQGGGEVGGALSKVFVVRHAQTDWNAQGILQGPRIDSGLSADGRRQAAALARSLRDEDLHVIYSSPMQRARETAQAIADALPDAPAVQVVPELYEMDYGIFVGQSVAEVRSQVEQVLDAWKMGFVDEAFPGGESAVLAQHRIRPFATRLRAAPAPTCVVGHGRINRILLATLLEQGLQHLEEFPQANANVTELRRDGERLVAHRINDTSHLEGQAGSFS
jgi:broad specificity phosphatase PhoE